MSELSELTLAQAYKGTVEKGLVTGIEKVSELAFLRLFTAASAPTLRTSRWQKPIARLSRESFCVPQKTSRWSSPDDSPPPRPIGRTSCRACSVASAISLGIAGPTIGLAFTKCRTERVYKPEGCGRVA